MIDPNKEISLLKQENFAHFWKQATEREMETFLFV
jgi:hypothetical protein